MAKKEKIIDMAKEWKRLDKENEKYIKTHNTMFVCPYCNSFLIPWSWYGKREKARRGYVFQYTCCCNLLKRKGSPSWYETVERAFGTKNGWDFFNGSTWISNPAKIPFLFNPSVR